MVKLLSLLLLALGCQSHEAFTEELESASQVEFDPEVSFPIDSHYFFNRIADKETSKMIDHDWFVMFKIPNCEHCKNPYADWQRLAYQVHQNRQDLKIGEVDCMNPASRDICDWLTIYTFPKFVYFAKEANSYYLMPVTKERTLGQFERFVYPQIYSQAYMQFSLPVAPQGWLDEQKIKIKRSFYKVMEENARGLQSMGIGEIGYTACFIFTLCFTFFPFYMIYNFLVQFLVAAENKQTEQMTAEQNQLNHQKMAEEAARKKKQ